MDAKVICFSKEKFCAHIKQQLKDDFSEFLDEFSKWPLRSPGLEHLKGFFKEIFKGFLKSGKVLCFSKEKICACIKQQLKNDFSENSR